MEALSNVLPLLSEDFALAVMIVQHAHSYSDGFLADHLNERCQVIVKQAEEFHVPVLLVRPNTMETIETIEAVFGKTRLGQASKLSKFESLLAEHLDYPRLYGALGL